MLGGPSGPMPGALGPIMAPRLQEMCGWASVGVAVQGWAYGWNSEGSGYKVGGLRFKGALSRACLRV